MGVSGLWWFVNSINFQIRQIPATKPTIFLGITTLFLLSLILLYRSGFLEKEKKNSHLFTFFKVGKIIVSEYGRLMLAGVFPDKMTPDIEFTDKAVVQCDVPVVKLLL